MGQNNRFYKLPPGKRIIILEEKTAGPRWFEQIPLDVAMEMCKPIGCAICDILADQKVREWARKALRAWKQRQGYHARRSAP
jgi:hypothetical protein